MYTHLVSYVFDSTRWNLVQLILQISLSCIWAVTITITTAVSPLSPSPFSYSGRMPRRTYEADGSLITSGEDLHELVTDKRQGWRATPAKARRRQRRYGKRLTKELKYADKFDYLDLNIGE